MRQRVFASLTSAVLVMACAGSAAVVTLNNGTKHQTMEGMGGFGGLQVWWSGDNPNTYYTPAFITDLVDSLGVTMVRDAIPPCFEDPNDNADPATLNLATINLTSHPYGDHMFATHVPLWKALKARGMDRIIVSIWSPARWMKTNNSHLDGGSVKPGLEEEFAERCVAFVKLVKQQADIDIYALNIQNEPGFRMPYESCEYTVTSYIAMLKTVAVRFAKEGITTKLFGPEDVINGGFGNEFVTKGKADADLKKYLWSYAVHGYGSDGASPYSGSATTWKSKLAQAVSLGSKLWMTETEGSITYNGPTDWNFAWIHGQQILSALRDGNVSGFAWWYMANHYYASASNGTWSHTRVWDVTRQFYRFIRPGMIRIETTSDDAAVYVVGFVDPATGKVSVVMINSADAVKSVTLSIQGLTSVPSSYTGIVLTQADRGKNLGTVAAGSAVALPAKSVLSLTGTFTVGTRDRGITMAVRANAGSARGSGPVYSLSGQVVRSAADQSRGVFFRRGDNGAVACVRGVRGR